MIWRSPLSSCVLLFVFLWIGTSSSKSLENTGRSLSDSLDESKVSSSISHLLKSLEPKNGDDSEKEKPAQIITKHGIITARESTISRNKSGRKLFFGDHSDPSVPAPVVVSSQAIRISGGSNGTGNKRARSLNLTPSVSSSSSAAASSSASTMGMSIDKVLDGVRTIEGVRVPDDEHDKHYTWRNARVIKNFLVPAGRPANPQRKRQILLQDARSYLDASSHSQPQQQQQSTIYFATPSTASVSSTGQDFTAALYAAAAQQQQQQQVQQQSQVYQYATANTGSQQQQQQAYNYPQQGQSAAASSSSSSTSTGGTMYVLQADGKTYLPYSTAQMSGSSASSSNQNQIPSTSNIDQSQYSNSQFSTRSGELGDRRSSSEETGSDASSLYQQQYQQFAALRFQQQQQQQQRQQAQTVQTHFIASTPIPTIVHSSQHQQHSSPHVSINPYSNSGAGSPSPSPSTLTHKSAHSSSLHDIAATAIPTGASIGAQLQEQVLAQTAQYLQVQQPSGQGQGNGPTTLYQFAGASPALSQPPQVLEERSSNLGVSPGGANGNQFVIHPQTYVNGGGQMFSVPIPIPADQVDQLNEQSENNNHQHKNRDENNNNNNNNNNKKDGRTSLSDRIRESLQFNRKHSLETSVGASAVVPVLATTGIFLGLGALAAGWYLSKSNREVGILRRTGKPAGGHSSSSSSALLGSSLLGSGSSSSSTKDAAINAHIREKRSSNGEVDQASFFQSIIQHGIEKQQKQYEDVEPEPMRKNSNSNSNSNYNSYSSAPSSQSSYSSNSNSNSNSNRRVQVKPLSYTRNDDQKNGGNNNNNKNNRAEHREDLDRHGKGGKGGQSVKNFAKVAIPAVILTGSVIAVAVLIFGWYISGQNREIAFLEPSAYSRRKRSLSSSSSSSNPFALSDGWFQRTMTTIHKNPYDETEGRTLETRTRNYHTYNHNHNNTINYDYDDNISSSSSSRSSNSLVNRNSNLNARDIDINAHGKVTEYDMTMLTVAFAMAAFAFGSLIVLAGAWYITDNSRQVAWADKGDYTFGHWPTVIRPTEYYYPHGLDYKRSQKRSITHNNDMTLESVEPENTGFLHKILGSLELSQSSLLKKLQEQGYSKWQETPCAKRIFCDVMTTQNDDTVHIMEKRMVKFLSMLPDSLSNSLSKTLGDVMMSINKKDCSAYTCGGHWVDVTAVPQPSAPSSQPR